MDYRRKTKEILRGYRSELEYIRNLEEEIRSIYESSNRLTTEYNEHIGHSSLEPVHPGARLAHNQKFQTLQQDLKDAKALIARIDRAIAILPETEQAIIQKRYFEPKPVPWFIIARELCYSEGYARELGSKAFRTIAVCFYGIDKILQITTDKAEKS